MKTDLVVFAEDWSAFHPSSTQQLVQQLIADRKVLWVNAFGLRRPRMSPQQLERSLERLAEIPTTTISGPTRGGLRVLAPRTVQTPAYTLTRDMTQGMVERQVRAALQEMGIERPLLWLGVPSAADMIGLLDERALVYYCDTDYSTLADVDSALLAEQERSIVAKADLIVVPHKRLLAKFPTAKTRLLPHGVDFRLFSTPAPRAPDLPAGVPTAGCYGCLPERLDAALLAETAHRLPHWYFVFIGPLDILPDTLRHLPNIRFLGPREHTELPGYVQHWDASLLPIRQNHGARSYSPLKLSEYLAAGRPIVTTELPALNGYRDLVRVANTPAAFAAALEAARKEGVSRRSERQARVAPDTWGRRSRELSGWLDAL